MTEDKKEKLKVPLLGEILRWGIMLWELASQNYVHKKEGQDGIIKTIIKGMKKK